MAAVGTDLVVLAGGGATRLDPLCEAIPKALLPVAGLPFLAWPLAELARSMFLRRIVICTKKGSAPLFMQGLSAFGYSLHILEETTPLGTGGAILSAMAATPLSDPFLAMNGDVLFHMDGKMLVTAAQRSGAALTSIAVADARPFGALDIAGDHVTAFREKNKNSAAGLVNAGLYAFTHDVLRRFANTPCSLEYDIAPHLAAAGRLEAVMAYGAFMDIGTPQTYNAAESFIRETARVRM